MHDDYILLHPGFPTVTVPTPHCAAVRQASTPWFASLDFSVRAVCSGVLGQEVWQTWFHYVFTTWLSGEWSGEGSGEWSGE